MSVYSSLNCMHQTWDSLVEGKCFYNDTNPAPGILFKVLQYLNVLVEYVNLN